MDRTHFSSCDLANDEALDYRITDLACDRINGVVRGDVVWVLDLPIVKPVFEDGTNPLTPKSG